MANLPYDRATCALIIQQEFELDAQAFLALPTRHQYALICNLLNQRSISMPELNAWQLAAAARTTR